MILRRTQSLCPICLRRIEAVYERPETAGAEKGVFLRKTCPEHGVFSVPAWVALEPVDAQGAVPGIVNAPPFESWSRPKSPSYPEEPRTAVARGCPFDCGLCPLHAQHTCTGLVEVTMRCDLACPVCYAGAGKTEGPLPPDPPLAALAAQLDSLKAASGAC
ncbi:MAG: radical SAM protein, partial [Desulfovibrio fairfieldensis]|nr:radical SAM protein [Desulfovibrio fairfieldensis]